MSNLRHGRLLTGIARILGSNLIVIVVQAIQFILLARILGVESFGQVAFANSVAAILVPVAGLGMSNVMQMEVSRQRSMAGLWLGNALFAAVGSGAVLVLLGTLASYVVAGQQVLLSLVILVLTTELLLVRVCTISQQYFLATEEFKAASWTNLFISLARLGAVLFLLSGFVEKSPVVWAIALSIFTGGLAVAYVIHVHHIAGGLTLSVQAIRRRLKLGLSFAIGTGAKSVYTDADKVMLGRFESSGILGAYASAYRLTVMAFLPVRTLLDVVSARFFRAGESGVRNSLSLSLKLLKVSIPYGIIAGLGMYFFAPVVPYILGSSFSLAPDVLKMLCLLPVIQAIHYVLSDALTGAGKQALRSKIQLFVVVVYLCLGAIFIPKHGWYAAAAVCIASEFLLALLIALAVFFELKTERRETNK